MKAIHQIYIFIMLLTFLTGKSVSARSDEPFDCIAYLQYTDGYWQVWLMSEDGRNKRQITHTSYDKSSLSWYPDAKALLINSNQGDLYKVNISTGKESEVDIGLKGMFDAVLSPDGQNISFGLSTSGSRDDHNIWNVDLKNKRAIKITNLKQMQHLPRWSADGTRVYFSSKTDDQHNDILRVQPDGKNMETITVNALYNFDAVESSEGDIVFSSNRSGNYEIWVQDKNGKLDQLTHRAARDARPDWSADGDRIAFESSQGGKMNIWILKPDVNDPDNKPVQITRADVGARLPVWGPANQQGLCN